MMGQIIKKGFPLILLAFSLVGIYSQLFAKGKISHKIHLKDGSIIPGKIIARSTKGSIKLRAQDGQEYIFKSNEIKKVVRVKSGKKKRRYSTRSRSGEMSSKKHTMQTESRASFTPVRKWKTERIMNPKYKALLERKWQLEDEIEKLGGEVRDRETMLTESQAYIEMRESGMGGSDAEDIIYGMGATSGWISKIGDLFGMGPESDLKKKKQEHRKIVRKLLVTSPYTEEVTEEALTPSKSNNKYRSSRSYRR